MGFSSLLFGKVVEATLAEEIGKWVVMGIFIVGIFEETFNQTLTNHICSNIYWIRIFNE